MARKPRPMPEPVDANIDEAVFGRTTQSLNELSLMNAQASENAQAIAKELGYEGSLSVGALEDEIRFYQRRTVEAVLELGKRLLILKELTPHGEFTERVAGLGINQNLARKFMAATLKFSKTVKSTVLKSIDTQSKLLELVVLDDAEIEALESGESARGLTLDKIETMSVSELKKALREAEADIDAKDKLISDKNTKLDELDTALRKKRLEKIPPDEEGEALRKEVSMTAFTAEAEIRGNLRAAFRALGEHTEKHGIPHDNFMKGLICQLELAIAQVRGEFHLVGEPDGDPTPAWLRPGAEEAATAVVDEAMAKNGWVRDANGKMIPAELAGKPWTLDETGKVVAAE